MSDNSKKEAKAHAELAAKQAQHAMKNVGEATSVAAELVKDEVTDVATGNSEFQITVSRNTLLLVGVGAAGYVAFRKFKPVYDARKAARAAEELRHDGVGGSD